MNDRRTSLNVNPFDFQFNVLRSAWYFSFFLSSFSSALAQHSSATQVYVDPSLWKGVLVLQSGITASDDEVSATDVQLLVTSIESQDARCLLAIDPATAQSPAIDKLLTDFATTISRVAPQQISDNLQDASAVASWEACEVIWIDTDAATSLAIMQQDEALRQRLIQCLREVLARGGFVRISGDLKWLDSRANKGSGLLAACRFSDPSDSAATQEPLLHLEMPLGARCGFAKRQMLNLSDSPVTIRIAPTTHYATGLTEVLQSGKSIDWVQWQRALLERQQPMFPRPERVEHRLAGGALVIGGGGGMPNEVWQRFVALAGGADSRIVILPTAVEDATDGPTFESRVLKQAGAEHIVTLPQTKLSEVEREAFLAELDKATGVWFGGGRQWRFVDAYWGTPAWEKLRDVCQRGGVIGGSSAGATIQGDLLVRGAPAGNHIMIADGYRHGLGLLPGVAIDQHFSQRNRFRELEGCLAEFPSICGIGIDEQTALIVTSPDQCEVIGTGSVWHYPSYDTTNDLKPNSATRSALRQEHKSGSQFSLVPK